MSRTSIEKDPVSYFPDIASIRAAAKRIAPVIHRTPCSRHRGMSAQYGADVFLKREDLQNVRSYKIRGAFNKMAGYSNIQKANGFVCASAGNHAQGFALSCKMLQSRGVIFMPETTPKQKIRQVEMFGDDWITIRLVGDTFDDAKQAAYAHAEEHSAHFVHPFDDPAIIEGQGTVGLEILAQMEEAPDYIFVPIGGGGLAAGVIGALSALSPETKIIGVEPQGAPAMAHSIRAGANVTLTNIDPFVDGAAVKRVGEYNFNICKDRIHDVVLVPEGLACKIILDMYNHDAIVVEPAGALTLGALRVYKEQIHGKKVVCILSGSNNDITRTEEIKERALLYEGLKHYFIVRFPQRAGALKEFVAEILGPNDDITHFEYTKKNSRERGSALVGIELSSAADFESLVQRMKEHNFYGEYINDNAVLMNMLV